MSNKYPPTNDQRNNLGPLLAPPIGGLVSALVDHMLKLLSILWSSAAPFASRSQWSDSRIHCVIGILVPLLRGIVYHSVPPSKNSLVNGVYYRGVEKDFHIMHAVQCTWYVTYWTNWSCKVGMFNPVILSIHVTLTLCTLISRHDILNRLQILMRSAESSIHYYSLRWCSIPPPKVANNLQLYGHF